MTDTTIHIGKNVPPPELEAILLCTGDKMGWEPRIKTFTCPSDKQHSENPYLLRTTIDFYIHFLGIFPFSTLSVDYVFTSANDSVNHLPEIVEKIRL